MLVENLRRLAERIVNGRAARHGADALADELLGLGGRTRRPLAFQRFEAARLSTAFTVQLVQRLREQDPESTPALRWLDEQLAALGTSADELVQLEHQNQAAMNVTVRNVITSMRMMSTFDWAEFFESVSLVDEVLRVEPHLPRDGLRHPRPVPSRDRGPRARLRAVRARRHPAGDGPRPARGRGRAAHRRGPRGALDDPGYYLLAQGRSVLEAELGYRVTPRQRFLRVFLVRRDPRLPDDHRHRDRPPPGLPAAGRARTPA